MIFTFKRQERITIIGIAIVCQLMTIWEVIRKEDMNQLKKLYKKRDKTTFAIKHLESDN